MGFEGKSTTLEGLNALQVSMPMGGLGAGCICLNGQGGLQDFSIRNVPATTAMPDRFNPGDALFSLLHLKGDQPKTLLVEGPFPPEKVYAQGNHGQGYTKGGFEGFPRFRNCSFRSKYPFGSVELSDPDMQVSVSIEGWSPFVPLDDLASGMPCAILNYTLRNEAADAVELEFSCHMAHPAKGSKGETGTRNRAIPGMGVSFFNTEESHDPTFGTGALFVVGHQPKIKASWFRGGWFDSISTLWRQASTGSFTENDGTHSDPGPNGPGPTGRNGGSLLVAATLEPGQEILIPIVVAWHFPNAGYEVGTLEASSEPCKWRPYYSTLWADAEAVAYVAATQFESLYRRTRAFRDALEESTIPAEVLDAVTSNLAILKSPTLLRQENGNIWAWEGCFSDSGCCHGSCTHVWNYAQALPHLFPALERTLREQEYLRSMDSAGHVNFRSALPDGPTQHTYHAASDGQLGGILKLYRDWHICGDIGWLKKMLPMARLSLGYCRAAWDPKGLGALFEPHHNTYDIEFWGPDGMCTTIYLGALCAMAEMLAAVGEFTEAKHLEELAAKSREFLESQLFNGEYFEQHVEWEGLRDRSFSETVARSAAQRSRSEMDDLLLAEGPKYQYGSGCLADGVIGAWMADLYGVHTGLSVDHVRSHLQALYDNNFKRDLSRHACTQRPGFAIGSEGGLLLCSWPRGGKPTLPFVYSDEVWTGIEYQVASHMILSGMVEEGLQLVSAVRARYDGRARNPFNEYECGNYYARAMSSYALLGALSGFRYSAATKTLWLAPKAGVRPFKTFFCVDSGFGTITVTAEEVRVQMVEGDLRVDRLMLDGREAQVEIHVTMEQAPRI